MYSKGLTPNNVSDLLMEHNNFFNLNQTKNLSYRLQQLKKLKAGIKTYEPQINEALKKDLGKHPFESYTS